MKSQVKLLSSLGAALLGALLLQLPARGATITWTNALGGSWNVAGNWNPNQVPGPSDQAVVALSGAYNVAVTSDENVGGLQLSGGTLTLNGALNSSNAVVAGGTLAGGANGVLQGIWSWSGGTIGSAGSGALTLAAQAVLTVSVTAGHSLTLAATLTNQGTILARGGGTLLLDESAGAAQLVNVAGASIQAQGNTAIAEQGAAGGSLINAGTLEVQAGTLTLGVPHGSGGGQFVADGGAVLALTNGYSFGPGAALAGGGTNLLSGGTVALSGNVTSSNAALAGATLAGTNATLLGTWTWTSGSLGANSSLTVGTNASLRIELTGNDTLVASGTLTNAGTILVQGNGSLQLNTAGGGGAVFNQNSGEISLQGSLALSQSGPGAAFVLNAGRLVNASGSNTTTVAVNLTNSGVVYARSGELNFTAGYSGAGGGLEFGIGGPQNSGSVNFTGAATLGGSLDLSLTSGFTPAVGSQFSILTYGSASGAFGVTNLSAALAWQTLVGLTQTVVGIVAASPPPAITVQPTNVTVNAGGGATFSVSASGPGPLGYQWEFEGLPLAGATNASLTLSNAQMFQAGAYAVVVADAAGSVTSSNALLNVSLGGTLGGAFRVSNVVQGAANLLLSTLPGLVYTVEYTENLLTPDWTTLQVIVGTGASVTVTDPAATSPTRFYRTRTE